MEQNKQLNMTQDIMGIILHFHIIVQKHKVVGAEEDNQMVIHEIQVMVLMVVLVVVKDHTVLVEHKVNLPEKEQQVKVMMEEVLVV